MVSAAREVQCPCCRIYYERENPRVFAPRTVSIQPSTGVCWDCSHHQGSDAEATRVRGRQHGQMLRREYEEARRQRDAAEHELALRPVRVRVRIENLDEFVVQEACRERDEAYHRRDIAMGALSDVRMHHHKRPEDKRFCVCGSLYAKCEMALIADRWDGVRSWEQSQAGSAYRGSRHYLDREHPALSNRAWFEEVYDA